MEQRTAVLGFTTLAAVAIAASAVRPLVPATSPAGAAPATAPAPKPAAAGPAIAVQFTRGEELLQRFFGGKQVAFDPRRYDFDVLIATLPDALDSHLDWVFDTGLEAIRRTFESSGYVVEGFWPPPQDTVDLAGRRRSPRREVEPGVMLFRGTDASVPRLRLLYLVPEVPTSGIYKDAFFTAFDERRRLLGSKALPLAVDRTRPIRIVGPVFSGSALSTPARVAPNSDQRRPRDDRQRKRHQPRERGDAHLRPARHPVQRDRQSG